MAKISKLSPEQNPGCFFHFELDNGGRVHIPPDQVMRMWNELEDKKQERSVVPLVMCDGKRTLLKVFNPIEQRWYELSMIACSEVRSD